MSRIQWALVPLLLLLSCGGHRTDVVTGAPDPTGGIHPAPGQSSFPALPPLPAPGSPTSVYRQLSATQVQVQADAATTTGGTGNQNQVNHSTHTLQLIPGGEDELSYAVYSVPNLTVNRPVTLNATTVSVHPGGEDPLEYWVMVSDYSTGRWKLVQGPNPDKSFSDANIVLNSATLRDRLVSPQGVDDPAFSYAFVTMGNSSNSSGLPFDQQPRLELGLSTITLLPVTDPGYFKTAPLPAQIEDARVDLQAGGIALDLVPAINSGADRIYIQRRLASSSNWVELGFVTGSSMLYTDPDDNTLPGATAPVPDESYVYRAIGATEDGPTELRAGPSYEVAVTFSGNLHPVAALTGLPGTVQIGEFVTFDASASADPDGTIAGYLWDLDGDGTFDATSAEIAARNDPTPAPYSYANPGTYFAAVRVTDNEGTSDIAFKQIVVNAPPSAFIVPDIADGNAPLTVNFDASSSFDGDGTITDYEWDFDGDLVFNEPGNGESAAHGNPLAQFIYVAAGAYAPTVRVTDNLGAQSTAFAAITVHDWTKVTVDSGGAVGQHCSLAVVNGKPAMSYYDATSSSLKYAFSSTLDGASGADWTCITMAASVDVGEFSSLAVIDGKPAIAYFDTANGTLLYAFSSTVDGANIADWSGVPIDPAGSAGQFVSLADVNGFPAVSYYDYGNGNLKYAYSTVADGSGSWTALVVDGFGVDVGMYSSLALVGGKPAISYFDTTNGHLKYAWSSLADGSGGWTTLTADNTTGVGQFTSLAVVNGFPAISFYDFAGSTLRYAWSGVADGSSGWSALQVDGGPDSVGSDTSLAVIGGFPAISYRDATHSSLKYAVSSASDGSAGWTSTTVDSTADVGTLTSLRLIDSKPAIGYYDAATLDLKYAFGL